jgi:hypothetical protein
MAFIKLDTEILNSTIWFDADACKVFITALLMAEPRNYKTPTEAINVNDLEASGFVITPGWYGYVPASGPGLVARAMVDRATGLDALVRLCGPEPESRTPLYEGRRMARVDGGYLVLNYDLYRSKDHGAAKRMAAYRERNKSKAAGVRNDA